MGRVRALEGEKAGRGMGWIEGIVVGADVLPRAPATPPTFIPPAVIQAGKYPRHSRTTNCCILQPRIAVSVVLVYSSYIFCIYFV
jgi:hypothetical protein